MAGIQDLGLAAVAQLAGVSTATVSNTINRPEMVTAKTRSKVEAAIRELDFVPNQAAAALRTGFNRLFGLVIPDVVNPFYATIVDAVSDAADRSGYSLALCVSHDDPAKELRQLDTLARQRAAGVLVVPLTADSSRLSMLRRIGSRLILVDRGADPGESCSVAIDDRHGGALAAEHLLDLPGDGLTLVNGLRSIRQCEDRRSGARSAVAGRGLDPDAIVEFETDAMTIDSGFDIGRRLVLAGAPRRVFCTNDQLALGVIRGMAAEGVRTPSDAVVVGYGDLALSTEGALPLSTVGQPKRAMGEAAVARLLAELTEGPRHHHTATLLEPELLVRESSTP
ncbi:LacI family transcriptional regulator [Curtobacterium sp. PhB137]|uniref:LacI family DNA-binding transcriptional regulator n=1 Tax=unclassified Curtobacterium TaxID=257496 RepID=UPI000F945EB2|nr:LacI family DNA-binding transcriptional regulator [Curtobacterium sp. PhB137]RPE84725.1 LacI family transcriptional regulator [Curtobacterium sp. PhB137]